MSVEESVSTAMDQQSQPGGPRPSREGSEAVLEALQKSGVEIVFGYTGGAVPSLMRSIAGNLPTFAGRTELTAAWMSYGYNRIKRRAASAVLTWAVGALHTAPAVYGAKEDGTPFLLMHLDNPPAMDARDPLQDAIELYSALKPLSKYIKKVTDAADLPVIVRQAVKEASTGRFGPSVLDLTQTAMYQQTSMRAEELVLPQPPSAAEDDVDRVWSMLAGAERPVLYIGAGVHLADAAAEVAEFTELTGIPVVSTSWGGRGVLPDAHSLYFGPSGNFGWRSANDALQQADAWLAVGVSFSQMSTGSWSLNKPDAVAHVDIDGYEIGKIFQPRVGVVADAKRFLIQLVARAREAGADRKRLADWAERCREMKREWLAEMASWYTGNEVPINQYFLIRTLADTLPPDALVVGDSGGHAFALYRAFEYQSVTQVATGGRYMSLGAGLPVAMGAKLAAPERTVVCFHGDGGFYYNLAELSNLAEHNIKVIVIIDNNHCLLANRASARWTGFDNPWVDMPTTTDFVTVAKGFGVPGERVDTPDQLAPAIRRALEADTSYVLDVQTEPGMKIVRALSNIIPIVGDRTPKKGHLETVLEGSWPS